MNYIATKELIDVISQYMDISDFDIVTENENWKGEKYISDYVDVIKEHGIGFEVLEGEIIVFFFGDHIHFYEFDDDGDTYVQRAKEFVGRLFCSKVVREEYYKGKTLVYDKHGFVNSDGGVDMSCSTVIYKIIAFLNPFLKKRKVVTVWRFNKETGKFEEEK